jgi:hypothetical protein
MERRGLEKKIGLASDGATLLDLVYIILASFRNELMRNRPA